MATRTATAIANIEGVIANRPDDSIVTVNDILTIGDLREVLHEMAQLRFAAELFKKANAGLGNRLLAGREDKLVRVPGKKPGEMKFFTKLGSEVAA